MDYKDYRRRDDARQEIIDKLKSDQRELRRTMERNDGWSGRLIAAVWGGAAPTFLHERKRWTKRGSADLPNNFF